MNNNNEFDVYMYQYDISHGAAKSFVKFMTGIDLEGDTIHAIPRFGKDRLDTLFVHVIHKYYIKL